MRVNTANASFLLLVCLCVSHSVLALQKDQPFSDYDEPLPNDPNAPKDAKAGSGDEGAAQNDPKLSEPEEEDRTKTRFTDDRFAKLYPSRGDRRSFIAKDIIKPKPTLPSFIKSTPPIVKAQISTTPAPRGGVARARQQITQATTRRGASTTTTPRPGSNNLRGRLGASTTSRPLTGRLTSARPTSGPSHSQASSTSPSAAALAARRRNGGNGGISRFHRPTNNSPTATNQNSLANNNSTIPALNPRRN